MSSFLLFITLFLILVDVFLGYEIPTHAAYVLLAIFLALHLDYTWVHKVLISILAWFALLTFHYLIWRKMIEQIHDKVIAPRKHTGGIEGMIGKRGVIKEIEGIQLLQINEELYEFENESNEHIIVGNTYEILKTESNKLII